MEDIVIAVEHLSKEYKFGKAVDDVSFQIREKGIYGLVGPNGAGKTTIMRMLGGLVYPTAGTIHMYKCGKGGTQRPESCLGDVPKALRDGWEEPRHHILEEERPETARRHMSFLIEAPYLRPGATACQNLEKQRLMMGLPDKERIHEVLEMVGLGQVDRRKPVRKYSLGMRQRLGIAGALLADPSVLVLDEPINGLDPEGIIEIRELLLRLNETKGITILISSHILTELSLLCTDYFFLRRGKIIKQAEREELAHMDAMNLEEYYLSIMREKDT